MEEITEIDYAERFLCSRELAQFRIAEEGRPYGIHSISDLILRPENFQTAEKQYDFESSIVRDENGKLTEDGIFRGIVYTILTPVQDYEMQRKVFDNFLKEGFNTPEDVLKNKEWLRKALQKANFNNQKPDRIIRMSLEWNDFDIYKTILEGLKHGLNEEVLLRDELSRNVFGLGEKTASILLYMCGAKHLIPIDAKMQEMLYFHGYPVEIKRKEIVRKDEGNRHKKRKEGIRRKEYLLYADYAWDLAEKYGVSGYELHLANWTKKSTYARMKKSSS